MSANAIEQCFDRESLEEEAYTKWTLVVFKDAIAVVVDPYMINLDDIVHANPNEVSIIRARRPAWGQGNLKKYIHVLR